MPFLSLELLSQEKRRISSGGVSGFAVSEGRRAEAQRANLENRGCCGWVLCFEGWTFIGFEISPQVYFVGGAVDDVLPHDVRQQAELLLPELVHVLPPQHPVVALFLVNGEGLALIPAGGARKQTTTGRGRSRHDELSSLTHPRHGEAAELSSQNKRTVRGSQGGENVERHPLSSFLGPRARQFVAFDTKMV